MIGNLAHVFPECLELHLIVVRNVLVMEIVRQIEHVSETDAKIRVLVRVDPIQNVMFKIINQYANVLKGMKEILMLDVT
jgi:hypothetical protein